jgi:hypothetical protein
MYSRPIAAEDAADLSPEERASAPGCPLRSEELKRAGFSVELMAAMFNKLSRI